MSKVISIGDRLKATVPQRTYKYSVTFRMHNLASAASPDEVENIILGIMQQTEEAFMNLEVVNYTIEEADAQIWI